MVERFPPGCYPQDGAPGPLNFRYRQQRETTLFKGRAVIRQTRWFAKQADGTFRFLAWGDISTADLLVLKHNLLQGECWVLVHPVRPAIEREDPDPYDLVLTPEEARATGQAIIRRSAIGLVPNFGVEAGLFTFIRDLRVITNDELVANMTRHPQEIAS